jgi:hypothetical protein
MSARCFRTVFGAILPLVALLALGGCGSSSAEPKTAAAVRQDYATVMRYLFAGDPRGCQLLDTSAQAQFVAEVRGEVPHTGRKSRGTVVTDCASAFAEAGKLNGPSGLTFKGPEASAANVLPITISGSRAYITGQGLGAGSTYFLYHNGRWLLHAGQ